MTDNCDTCSNRVGIDYCTMQKDMKLAMFKQCDGYINLPKKLAKPVEIKKRIVYTNMEDFNFASDYVRFIHLGGSWSFPQNKRII